MVGQEEYQKIILFLLAVYNSFKVLFESPLVRIFFFRVFRVFRG